MIVLPPDVWWLTRVARPASGTHIGEHVIPYQCWLLWHFQWFIQRKGPEE